MTNRPFGKSERSGQNLTVFTPKELAFIATYHLVTNVEVVLTFSGSKSAYVNCSWFALTVLITIIGYYKLCPTEEGGVLGGIGLKYNDPSL